MSMFDGWVAALLAASTFDESLVAYLKSTALSHWVVGTRWVWPISEMLHFMGLALLIGLIAPLDLRLMGFMKKVSVSAFRSLVPWAILGFVINLVTGVFFFVGTPEQYVGNTAWWFKVFFLLLAGLNVLVFETVYRTEALAIGPGTDTTPALKAVGAVSLASWMMVMIWGRMLPFLGNAF